ncbi:MAG: cytochrome c-type biogenesis protein [Methylocella sp.]
MWAIAVWLALTPAFAVQPDEILKDPVLEARARALSGNLRCLVCQNQSIDDSDAPLARDLRLLIRERLVRGETDSKIVDFITGRYGDFVLLKPRLNTQTVLLWLGPFAVLMAAGIALWRRRRTGEAALEQPLSGSEVAALQKTLGQDSIKSFE